MSGARGRRTSAWMAVSLRAGADAEAEAQRARLIRDGWTDAHDGAGRGRLEPSDRVKIRSKELRQACLMGAPIGIDEIRLPIIKFEPHEQIDAVNVGRHAASGVLAIDEILSPV